MLRLATRQLSGVGVWRAHCHEPETRSGAEPPAAPTAWAEDPTPVTTAARRGSAGSERCSVDGALVSAYPAELFTVFVALDLLEVDGDHRIASAVGRTTERLDPLVVALDYVTIDWDALEAIMSSREDKRKLRLAHELLETTPDKGGAYHLHDGTYYILGTIEDGKFRRKLKKVESIS